LILWLSSLRLRLIYRVDRCSPPGRFSFVSWSCSDRGKSSRISHFVCLFFCCSLPCALIDVDVFPPKCKNRYFNPPLAFLFALFLGFSVSVGALVYEERFPFKVLIDIPMQYLSCLSVTYLASSVCGVIPQFNVLSRYLDSANSGR